MPSAITLPWTDVDEATRDRCAKLWHRVWPKEPGGEIAARRARMDAVYPTLDAHQFHLAFDGDELIAVARTFRHTVGVLDGSDDSDLDVIALASVCSDPDRRGEGWGDAVTQAAFDRVETEGLPCLYQTPVPAFYERFGSRQIHNEIITSVSDATPFEEDWIMVHPATAAWPEGSTIDLRGSGW